MSVLNDLRPAPVSAASRGSRALRLMLATAVASVMTVFAVLGMVHLVQLVLLGLEPNPIVVSEASLDFGRVPVYGIATHTLVVRNDGSGPLHARFEVVDPGYMVDPEEMILEPGVERNVTVVANPERPGRLVDLLRIRIVGGGVAPVVIPLAAEGAPERPRAEPGSEMTRV